MGREGAQQRLQVPGVAPHGQVLLRPPRPRATIRPVCAPLPPDLIGMDAWARGHDRVREFSPRGHTGRRMAPPLVRPSRQHPQHEGHDAAAIGAAVSRPNRQRLPCAGSCPLFHAGAAGLEDCEQTALPGAGAKPMRLHHTRLAALSSWSWRGRQSAQRSSAAESPLGTLMPPSAKRWLHITVRPFVAGSGEGQPTPIMRGGRQYWRSRNERPITAQGSGIKAYGLMCVRGRCGFAR
jgi:hypothetical protein